jgi:hypothetical protein
MEVPGIASLNTYLPKIFESDRTFFYLEKLTVNFNVKRPAAPLSPDPGSAPDPDE